MYLRKGNVFFIVPSLIKINHVLTRVTLVFPDFITLAMQYGTK